MIPFDKNSIDWARTLPRLGIDHSYLTRKHGPCPVCGGNDRFRFINRNGTGNWVCRRHNEGNPGGGDAIQLLMDFHHWDYKKTISEIGGNTSYLTTPAASLLSKKLDKDESPAEKRAKAERAWLAASPLTGIDYGSQYLLRRIPGLNIGTISSDLRYTEKLWILNDQNKLVTTPALLALVRSPAGIIVGLHKTPIDTATLSKSAKKRYSLWDDYHGAAIRLMSIRDHRLGISEGIENALSGYMLHGIPAWSALNELLLKNFKAPANVTELHVYGDCDLPQVFGNNKPISIGIKAANTCAIRNRRGGIKSIIRLSPHGTDWNEQYLNQCMALQQAGA